MAKPADPADPWLSRDEAAERLSLKSKTLAMWAYRDQGPRYYRFNGGPCRYRLSDVLAWVESQAAGGNAVMRYLPQSEHCDLGLDSEADQTPDLRLEKKLPPTSTAKHPVEGIQPIPTRGADL